MGNHGKREGPMSDRKKRYEERLTKSPILRQHLDAILDIAENADGKFETADEAEETAIEQLQRLGN